MRHSCFEYGYTDFPCAYRRENEFRIDIVDEVSSGWAQLGIVGGHPEPVEGRVIRVAILDQFEGCGDLANG